MKKSLFLIIFGFILLSANAQKKPGTYWTTIGGLKAGYNNSNIRFGDNSPVASTSDAWNYGAAAGLWVSLPLGDKASFQPELLYSGLGGNATFPGALSSYTSFNKYDLKSGYLSVPLLLKLHYKKLFAIYAGPQFGFLISAKADVTRNAVINNEDFKDSMNTTDVALAGGIQLFPKNKVHLDFRYIYGVTNFWESKPGTYYNQAFQFTLGVRLWGKKITIAPPDTDGDGINDKDDKCPTVAGVKEYQGCPVPDTDGDGVNDLEDKCPTVAGVKEYQSCPIPDTDGDGINDKEDKCPAVAGVKEYQGCPIPDTDGDGLNDKEDKCPTVAGVKEFQGCPIPDTDGDGVNDKEDKCPTLAGPKENQGCPVVTEEVKKKVGKAANNILFITGSSKLASSSYKGLDEVVKILKDNPDMHLAIDGHTDNVGKDEFNQTLSEKRANTVKDYFVSKGIDENRIISAGHGETEPIADNKTAAGRQKNRRVELKLSYY
ncbi:MAG: outer membrane beta-barrel protein [Chitinophagaceae bacterium]